MATDIGWMSPWGHRVLGNGELVLVLRKCCYRGPAQTQNIVVENDLGYKNFAAEKILGHKI